MKWILLLYLLVVFIGNTAGQDNPKGADSFSENPVNLKLNKGNFLYITEPRHNNDVKSAKKLSPTFRVTYRNFPEEAKNAFNYAVSIWEELIYSPIPIHIEARWEELNGNILAKGNPSIFYNNFSGTPIRNVYYPVALAEKIAGKDLNAGAPDIICKFSNKYDWYFGTDGNPPPTHYDMVSSALHEITHGLGFSGFLNERDGKGYYNNNNELPSIYDYLLFNNNNQQISDRSLFKSQSAELFEQITSDNIMFCKSSLIEQQQKMIDWIFAPPVWNDGTSIYHLKGYEYGQHNSLMAPYAVKGRAIHDPGEVTLTILAELGWKNVIFDFSPLKDIEKAVAEWPVQVNLNTQDEELKNIKVVYSFDDFETSNHVYLKRSETFNYFTGSMNLAFHTGQVKYYIEAVTADNRYYRHPAVAPSKLFTMNVGPDKFEPQILHSSIDIIAGNTRELKIYAEASDNVGIKKLQVDYKVNGNIQKPVYLADPVYAYTSNYESNFDDFAGSNFAISPLIGYTGNILHTILSYPVSEMENERLRFIAQLKYPIVIQEGGQLKFDEIVLVEPGRYLDLNGNKLPWDDVVVEASKHGGSLWYPLTEKLNAGKNINGYTAFTNSLTPKESSAYPHEGMFYAQGKTIHQRNDYDSQHSNSTGIDLSSVNPGMYMISINDGARVLSPNKISKN